MEVLETLGAALGLATLAGVNLYLTVAITGASIYFQWVTLPPHLESLSVLGDPWIIGIASALYFIEFLADKIPWLDSANDAIHTFIRPVGGLLLAILALGEAHPAILVIAALLAGGASLTAHATKAGTRLVANASPEPLSNIALSLGEDAIVLGGLALLVWNPIITASLIALLLIGAWFTIPLLIRKVRCIAWLAWSKLNAPASSSPPGPAHLPSSCLLALRRAHQKEASPSWVAACFSAGGPLLPKNFRGFLLRVQGEASHLFFVAPRWLRGSIVVKIPLQDAKVRRESRFLSEVLIIENSSRSRWTFLFERSAASIADQTASEIGFSPQTQKNNPPPPDPPPLSPTPTLPSPSLPAATDSP